MRCFVDLFCFILFFFLALIVGTTSFFFFFKVRRSGRLDEGEQDKTDKKAMNACVVCFSLGSC